MESYAKTGVSSTVNLIGFHLQSGKAHGQSILEVTFIMVNENIK